MVKFKAKEATESALNLEWFLWQLGELDLMTSWGQWDLVRSSHDKPDKQRQEVKKDARA